MILRLLGVFLVFFLIFAILGAVDTRNSRDDLYFETALDYLAVEYTPEVPPEARFVFSCPQSGITYFTYDIDLNKPHPARAFAEKEYEALGQESTRKGNKHIIFAVTRRFTKQRIVQFLGGATGGWTVWTIAAHLDKKPSRAERLKEIVAGLLGGASGYALGSWVAHVVLKPECDSLELLRSLESADPWIKAEIAAWVNWREELKLRGSSLIEKDQRDALRNDLIELKRRHSNSKDLTTAAFVELLTLNPEVPAILSALLEKPMGQGIKVDRRGVGPDELTSREALEEALRLRREIPLQ